MKIGITERMRIWLRVLWSLWKTFGGVKCNVLSSEETVNEILKGKSLIRFGDGEFGIYQGKDIHYQEWSTDMREKFVQIKEEYEQFSQDCPYLLAVPNKFMKMSSMALLKRRVWASSWAEARFCFKKNFDTRLTYGDAFVFEKKNRCIYEKIWEDVTYQNIIFIHNNEKYAREFARRYNKNVVFVKCPAKNAFQELQSIMTECEEKVLAYKLEEKVQILISAGPAGKILAYYFSNKGYHCVDAGHCWDEPLESD